MQNPRHIIFWTQQTGLPSLFLWVFLETNTHILIDYLVCDVSYIIYIFFLSHSLHSDTLKDPNPALIHTVLLFFSFYSETFLPTHPYIPPAQDGNNNNNALDGGLGDFMAWKKGIRSVYGIDGARFPFSPNDFYF